MKSSESTKGLDEALAKAQAELENPHFDGTNPHFKSKFASLAAVRAAVIPILSRHSIALSQWPVSDGDAAGCVTRLAWKGEFVESAFLIPVDKHNAHGYASAVTYAKRIAMQSVVGVVGEEDDDGNAAVEGNLAGARNGKAAMKPITPTTGMLDSLEIDQQNYCMDVARRVEKLFTKGDLAGATDEWESEAAKLNDMSEFAKAGTWSLIDSKARSAIKAEQVRRKPQLTKEAA